MKKKRYQPEGDKDVGDGGAEGPSATGDGGQAAMSPSSDAGGTQARIF